MFRIFPLLLFAVPFMTNAQEKLNLTLTGGFSNYSGDLQEKRFTLDQSHLSIGAGLSYELFPKFLIRGAMQYGKIGADDKFSDKPLLRERNLNFKSSLFEGSLIFDYSLFDLKTYKNFTPYVFAGIAMYHFNPYTYDTAGSKTFLRNLSTEGQGLAAYPDRKKYKLVQFSIPFGGGLRFKLTENTYLTYEIGLRKTFTDYLDDVSTTFVDQAALRAARGAKAVELAFRGDELKDNPQNYPPDGGVRGGPKYKDWYYFSGLTLSIGILNGDGKLFGKKVYRGRTDCPRSVL